MIDDNYDILHDLGWWYKPYYITKKAKSVSFLPKELKVYFYEFEFMPPDYLLN